MSERDSAAFARSALNRARVGATARGLRPGPPRSRGLAREPGSRDPQPIGDALAQLFAEQGWQTEVNVGHITARWPQVVGTQVAHHCFPESFELGVLTLRTSSTTWATQVRLLEPTLLERIAQEIGPGIVAQLRVLGPAGPRRNYGPRRVAGRGPRDTWG